MLRVLAVLGCILGAGPALAGGYENCSRTDAKMIDAAIAGAAGLAMQASAVVGDTPEYALWVGAWSDLRAQEVQDNLQAIHVMLNQERIGAVCVDPVNVDCKDGTFAWVQYDRPGVIHLCPSFFHMPSMEEARGRVADIEHGTREGTVVHELSHFPFLANTGDDCYGRTTCRDLARRDPVRAVATADSYQYFAEDVMLAIWALGP